eukprot:1111208-Pyramimonas_sp.AAC.1
MTKHVTSWRPRFGSRREVTGFAQVAAVTFHAVSVIPARGFTWLPQNTSDSCYASHWPHHKT